MCALCVCGVCVCVCLCVCVCVCEEGEMGIIEGTSEEIL